MGKPGAVQNERDIVPVQAEMRIVDTALEGALHVPGRQREPSDW
jgi:hypothetical protein